MPKQFAPQPDEDFFKLSHHFGSTVSITVQEYMPKIGTVNGLKPAIKADVTIVDGLQAGRDFGDVIIFDAAVVKDLKDVDIDGDPIVALVDKYVANGRDCVRLKAPTADAWAAAEKLYLPAQPESLPY